MVVFLDTSLFSSCDFLASSADWALVLLCLCGGLLLLHAALEHDKDLLHLLDVSIVVVGGLLGILLDSGHVLFQPVNL